MQSLTSNKIGIELFGQKLWLSERTARDQSTSINSVSKGIDATEGLLLMAIAVRDGLKINLIPFKDVKFWELKKKRQLKKLKKIINPEMLLELPVSVLSTLQDKILELEGVDIDAIKKKVKGTMMVNREGLAVTLETA